MPVNTERKDYKDYASKWERLRDCYAGRDAVLKAGAKYVPDLPGAPGAASDDYRKRGNFYNAVRRTARGLVGSIFQEAPEVEFPPEFEDHLDDITLTNIPFEMFAADAGLEILLMGRFGVLVDMPTLVVPGQEQRPYLVPYKAEHIINWRTRNVGGDDVLDLLVLREVVNGTLDEKDPFNVEAITQYRCIKLIGDQVVTQLWRENPKYDPKKKSSDQFIPFGEPVVATRRGQPLTFIPFVFIGPTHATPELEDSPLLDMMEINLAHWRNSVDHEYGLHLVALPTPWVSGMKGSTGDSAPLKLGPSVVWELDLNGTAGMLEFEGSGLAALVAAMDEKRKQMASLGARLIEDAPQVGETAAAVRLRHSGENASLRTVAQAIEKGFTLALQIFVWWLGTEEKPVETEVSVELNKDYLNFRATSDEIRVALTALQAGEISFETWWNLLMTGGWGRKGVEPKDEMKLINEQRPPEPEPDDSDDDDDLDPDDPDKKKKPKSRTIKDAAGNVRYRVEED